MPVSFAFDFISLKKNFMSLVTAPKIEMLLYNFHKQLFKKKSHDIYIAI